MTTRPTVAVLQYRLLHYRLELFELMRAQLRAAGVEMVLVYGQASETEKLRKDEGTLDWATRVHNTFMRAGGRDIVWQPLPENARKADLLVTMQENRILSNYLHQIKRSFGGPMVGFWGHGRNFQSTNSGGLRERWKKVWINKVDWWFSYTDMSTKLVLDSGFPAEKITTLNNAIDVGLFQRQLAAVRDEDMVTQCAKLGIDEQARVAIFCGSLYPEKKIGLLLASADIVRTQVPNFHLVVIGDGPSAGEVREAAKTRPWIHVLGVKKGDEKALYFKRAQVQLNPGLVGLHVLDAFSASLPMITTANALHSPEIAYLVHGRNGWVCATDDAPEYAGAVSKMLNDETFRSGLAANCLADSRVYTVERMAENFVAGIVACLRLNGRLR